MYFKSLGMPLVKTVTRAGPGGKLFTGVEVKVVSDQPAIGSTRRKAIWLLSMSGNLATGSLDSESWEFPPEACDIPWKREPVSTRRLPSTSGEVAVAISGCQSGRIKSSPMSYNSAKLRDLPLNPPATSTLPLGSNVAVCLARPMLRLPVALPVPLAGSYSSALLGGPPSPPATSTLPLGSNVAVCLARRMLRVPVALHVPLAGSYSSAVLRKRGFRPPATSTLPLASNVAVCSPRAVLRLPVTLH